MYHNIKITKVKVGDNTCIYVKHMYALNKLKACKSNPNIKIWTISKDDPIFYTFAEALFYIKNQKKLTITQ